jgi:hypothetical protein
VTLIVKNPLSTDKKSLSTTTRRPSAHTTTMGSETIKEHP